MRSLHLLPLIAGYHVITMYCITVEATADRNVSNFLKHGVGLPQRKAAYLPESPTHKATHITVLLFRNTCRN